MTPEQKRQKVADIYKTCIAGIHILRIHQKESVHLLRIRTVNIIRTAHHQSDWRIRKQMLDLIISVATQSECIHQIKM